MLALGADQAAIKSKRVTIEASGACKVWGHKGLKLQEAEKVKGGKGGAGGEGRQSLVGPSVYDEQLRLINQSTGKPLADCPYVILRDDHVLARGRTDKDGMTVRVSSGGAEAELLLIHGDDALDWE